MSVATALVWIALITAPVGLILPLPVGLFAILTAAAGLFGTLKQGRNPTLARIVLCLAILATGSGLLGHYIASGG